MKVDQQFLNLTATDQVLVPMYSFYVIKNLKDTLMQISKSFCMFQLIKKEQPENFACLILRILELFGCKVCKMFVYKHTETIEYVKK